MIFRNQNLAILFIVGFIFQSTYLSPVLAQSDPVALSPENQTEIIEALSQLLLAHYVLPAEAASLADTLRAAQSREEYAESKSMGAFLDHTNELLQIMSNDKHLRLLGPRRFDEVMAMFYGDDTEQEQETSGGHSQPQPDTHGDSHRGSGPAAAPPSQPDNPLAVVGVRNVSEISRDGLNQTGYLDLERFDGSARSVAFIARVFSTFTESDNIIIDLRNCGGGDAEMVKILSSYFFEVPTHLLSTTMPDENNDVSVIVERWTTPNELSSYFAEKPVKVLISSDTFSAAESFAFGMQVTGRAELVGETTGGGGYINDFFPLPHGFGASISVGRTYDPRTGNDWQGVGVLPEVRVEQDHALITALAHLTDQSGKLNDLGIEELQIYEQIQRYSNAWYGADHEVMRGLLAEEFIAVLSDHGGTEIDRVSAAQLVAATADGKGERENRIYYNRIIRDIEVSGEQASVTLILRETIHRMSMTKIDGEWLIHRDEYKHKRRDRA